MKRKILFLFLLTFMFIGVANASGTAFSPSGISINVDITESGTNKICVKDDCPKAKNIKMKVTGLPENLAGAYLLFGNEEGGATTCAGDGSNSAFVNDTDPNFPSSYKNIAVNTSGGLEVGVVSITNNWFLWIGFDYANIFYLDSDGCHYSSASVSVERRALDSYDKRYTVKFDNKNLILGINYPFGTNANYTYTMHTKIGPLNDELTHSVISTSASLDSLSDVIIYGITDTNAVTVDYTSYETLVTSTGGGISKDISSLSVEENKLYYVYTYYDLTPEVSNIGGHDLRELSGVNIAIGRADGTLELADAALYKQAVDPGENPDPGPGTVPNPSTGLTIGIVGMLLFLGAVLILFKNSKRKFYKI